jgi:hypothetical protein
MKINDLTRGPKKFSIVSDTPLTFNDIKSHPDMLAKSGPHTAIIDVSDHPEVAAAPGDNKRNAMIRLFNGDTDEITCANSFGGKSWYCVAFNIEI